MNTRDVSYNTTGSKRCERVMNLKEKVYNAIRKYIVGNTEFSKRFTVSIRNFMFLHVCASFIACVVLTVQGLDWTGIVEILTAMMPVYIALQSANYVKSGFENWKKISTHMSPQSEEEEEEVENG